MAGVVLKNLTKAFGKNVILNDINLEIQDKEFCVLVGASGCGKSTLLRMIAGLEDVTSGQIYIGDKLVNGLSARDRDIAMVFQSYALYPHMSVYENIAFGLKMRKLKSKDIDEKVLKVSEILGLGDYLNRKPKELSGGQRQRVALGRAIVREPKIFLMDEPLSNLDAKLRSSMRSEIKKLHQELKTTFIYVTHDQTEALTMGDKIVVLDGGSIAQSGTGTEIYTRPKNTFVATFMGSLPTNIIEAKLDEDGILQMGTLFIKLEDYQLNWLRCDDCTLKELLVGIRPENICYSEAIFDFTNDFKFSAKIDFEETLGAEKIVYFELNGAKCSAKVDAQIPKSDCLDFTIATKDFLFFHPQTKLLLNKF